MTTPILSPHFAWAELTRTEHRDFLSRNAELALDVVEPLRALCTTILEPLRAHFGAPVVIHSGYRCPELNAAIHGAATSQHMNGEAADLHVVGVALFDVWTWIWRDSGVAYGQALLEGHAHGQPGWVHVSLGEPWRPRARCRQHTIIADAP